MLQKINLFAVLTAIVLAVTSASAQTASDSIRTLIVIFDGLRPDYITPEAMPNVNAFRKRGSYGNRHHSVFPTVTRVNSSSFATGSYPATHGLMGNTVYFPQINKTKGLNTGNASELMKVSDVTNGQLLTTVSMGEALQQAGAKMMVFSSGSTGQAFLQNHKVSGGAVVNPGLILPESLKPVLEKEIGPIPAHATPNSPQHQWVTDALLKYGLRLDGPLVSTIWFSDPDGTAHGDGIGFAKTMASIKSVDEQFGRILADLDRKQLTDNFNIIISADHGFVTHIGKNGIAEFLIKAGLKKDKESEDVVVVGGAVYVQNHDESLIKKIVSVLQAQEWIGGIFTKAPRPGETQGWVKGTVSFDAVHWNHAERSADILVDYNWNDDKNGMGYAGSSFSGGIAGHGCFSPYEVHIPLIAAGPSFKNKFESELPTSFIDIVPTVLHIHHIPVPKSMDGRVFHELLSEDTEQPAPVARKETIISTAPYNGGTYTLRVEQTVLGKYRYIDYTKVERVTAAKP
jgi:arylsulfatase A-like enzyme